MSECILAALPEAISKAVRERISDHTEEIRIRVNRVVVLRERGGILKRTGCTVNRAECESILEGICAHSIFAYEDEINECYVTLRDGSRVGLCGRQLRGGIMPQGFNFRLARQIPGAGDRLIEMVTNKGLCSALIISAPGVGKTTVLRDAAKQLSNMGYQVSVADERGEITAPAHGIPGLDVGEADVMCGCKKELAMRQMVRAMAPQVIITDELATGQDAAAVLEASGCGVKVIASAHAEGAEALMRRKNLVNAIRQGAFERIVLLRESNGKRTLTDITGDVLCG